MTKAKAKKSERINENTLAKVIAKREGLVEQLSIAQIKEVLRITLEEMSVLNDETVRATLEHHRPRWAR